jgi:chorismate mutase/prephenate dehydratase
MATAVYQGVDGAYSQLVAQEFLQAAGLETKTLGVATYREVATALAGQRADIGVIPIENAIVGTVRDGYDLVAEFALQPVAEVLMLTDHRLLGVVGATLGDVREVLAHPLVIAECGKFLASLPQARAIPCEDTGVAAREVARRGSPTIAALAPQAAARAYGLIELAAHCADDPRTYTRFLVVRSGEASVGAAGAARKTSLIFTLADAPGALVRCLSHFGNAGTNVSKLESKPRLGHGNDHTFYCDIDGDIADPRVAAALDALRADSRSVTVLGSYDAHVGAPIGSPEQAVVVRLDDTARAYRQAAVVPPNAVTATFPRVARPTRPEGSFVQVGNVRFGDGEFVVIAGPCAVESREQIIETAHAVKARGATMLRGGAFKPRTSPYAFQGLGWEGVALLAEAGRVSGLPTVSEVMTIDQVDRMAAQVDMLQIGARNMQNFDLLKAVGRCGHPVLLKRGLSATIDEVMSAAEYILSEGNPNVVLCERGIRTFETATRNTLDLSAVPVLRERTHLPVIVDPSHGVGVRRWVRPMCRAIKAVGAHGLIVEVHPNPPEAKSDKEQAQTFDDLSLIVSDLEKIPLDHTRPAVIA